MSADEVRSRFAGEPLATVAKMATHWFENANEITFHDPLAAALIFHPELCTYESGQVEVDPTNGHTKLVPGNGADQVAKTVDVDGFFAEYFRIVHGT